MCRIVVSFAVLALLFAACHGPSPGDNNGNNAPAVDTGPDGVFVPPPTDVVTLSPEPYAEGCSTHEDCVLVTSSYHCACGAECGYEAVLASEEDAYLSEFERRKDRCRDDLGCTIDFDCFDEGTIAYCASGGTCAAANNPECIDDADCADVEEWTNPDGVRCEAQTDELTCVECDANNNLEPGGCPEGYHCYTNGRCRELQACAAPADCQGADYGERLGCVDGYCHRCREDADCADGQICVDPGPNALGCFDETKVDPRCLDDTCPGACGLIQDEWDCREDPFPGVDFPELSDFDRSCGADVDCAAVTTRRWTRDCECECEVWSLNSSDADAYEEAWPETKSRYGCESEPDCSCPDGEPYCDGDRCLIR